MTIGNLSPYSSYKRGCRCDECVDASRKYGKTRRVAQARGISLLVPTDRARAHVAMLTSSGVSIRSIAQAIGYSPTTGLNTVLSRHKIRSVTEQKILAVTPDQPLLMKGWVPATGTIRRLQALGRMGWTLARTAEEMNVHIDSISNLRNGTVSRTTERIAAEVRAVYDRLHMIDGGSTEARRRAVRNGWAPPLAWDDIDNPNEKPRGATQ